VIIFVILMRTKPVHLVLQIVVLVVCPLYLPLPSNLSIPLTRPQPNSLAILIVTNTVLVRTVCASAMICGLVLIAHVCSE
jgi:hypothetical protein